MTSPIAALRLVAALAVCLLLAGCQADIQVSVEVEDAGSGMVAVEVFLDAEAADAVLDLDANADGLPLRDLADAGWVIDRLAEDQTGTTIRVSKGFASTAQFGQVMDELSGEQGLFQDFALERRQSFGRLDYAVTGTIDTTAGLAGFSDPSLEQALGRSVASLAESYGVTDAAIDVTLDISLPGELREDSSTGALSTIAADPEAERPVPRQVGLWTTKLSTVDVVEVSLATTQRSILAQVLRGFAVVAAVLSALIIFGGLLRLAGSRSRRKAPQRQRPADAHGRTPEQVAAASSSVAAGREKPEEELGYRVVALDGMGVLYREGDDIAKLLIPFARAGGSILPDDEIAGKARLVSLGRMTSAEFWQQIGVAGDPNELDTAYLASHQLMPGVVKYLRTLRDRGIRAACITNDGARWATKLRASHSLEGLIDQWVVSGSVGVRKPDRPIFEVLRRVTSEPASAILIVDDDLDTLDAARIFGFGTAWFSPDGDRDQARGHRLFRSFDVGEDETVVRGEPEPASE